MGQWMRWLMAVVVGGCVATAGAQVRPVADHHAHLQSAEAARLLNEGESSRHKGPDAEKETPHTAAELIAQLDAGGVVRATALSDAYRLGSPFVHVPHEAAAVDAENDWTLQQVRQYPRRLVGFCSVNPTRGYALAAIEHCAQIGLRGGLKLHLANAKFDFEDGAQVRALRDVFAAADRLRMPILIHLRSGEAWDARRSVKVFMEEILPAAPDVVVQVAHAGGWGGYDRSTDEALGAFADACAAEAGRCRNLYFDISAVVLDPSMANAAPGSDDRELWDEQKDLPDGAARLAANLRRVGLARILFATDWPNTTAKEYERVLRAYLRLTPAEIDGVFGNVAPYFEQVERARAGVMLPGKLQVALLRSR